MLETILQRLLGRYLEPYVYNLSRENLRLGVLSGNLVLENLKLKENLGDILHLPLTISSGLIGHVSITIPWTSLGYKPLVIKLKNIHVIVKPKDYGNIDEETLRKELRESKEKLIEFKEKRLNERFLNGELINKNFNNNGPINDNGNNNSQSNNVGSGVPDENSANGTNLLWRIIKKIVANIQLEVQDIHVCMMGFQSKNENRENLGNSNSTSDIIMGIMMKSGFLVTTDSSGNKNFEATDSKIHIEDPNALFKTVEINDVGVYIGQYFPNSFNFNSKFKHANDKSSEVHSNESNKAINFDLINIGDVRNKLLNSSDNKLNLNSDINQENSHILESKYLIVYDRFDTHKSIGAWRLEYILKPLTFHLNISHFPNNNELRGILQVHSITEHTIILRRSHLRPIIFCIQSLNERQEKYRKILLKDANLVSLDPISLKTTTQDEYISLYSRKLKLEAIKLYNNEGNETNFFGVIIQPLTSDEINRLQILDDVVSVRHITKWRCKAREAINRIIIEASSRKKLRNLPSETRSVHMEKGNLLINNEMVSNLGIKNSDTNNSWTKWAISKIIGTDNNRGNYLNNNSPSSPSYLMQERGIYSNNDFTVTSNNSLITEEEMDVIMTAVTNEKYFEKVDTPTKFSITFSLAYFGITVFDDVSKPILGDIKSDLSNIYSNSVENDINKERNITIKFIESIPNPSIDSTFLSLKLNELCIQFNIKSVIDRNDKDSYEWNFSTYIKNLSLYHYKHKILFFDDICNLKDNKDFTDSKKYEKNHSVNNIESIIEAFSGFESLKSRNEFNQNRFLSNSSVFIHIKHDVNQDGNSLKFILRMSPLEIFITPHFISDLYSLLYLYNSIILIPEKVSQDITKNNSEELFINNCLNNSNENVHSSHDSMNVTEGDSSEFVEELIERSHNVKYFSQNNSLPDFIYFDIQILSPIFHIMSNDFKNDDSLCSIQIILGNCCVNTKTLCELNKLDIYVELSNTQVKYLTYNKNIEMFDLIQEKSQDIDNFCPINELKPIREFMILHPIPIFINMNIHNQKGEEINNDKDHLSIILRCNLQQFILKINNDTLNYLLHIPLSFYNCLALPTILGYYYLPQNTLDLTKLSNKSNKINPKSLYADKTNDLNSLDVKNENSSFLIKENNSSNIIRGNHSELTNNVLLLMNKTMKIECYTKSDILSFTILSKDEQIDILQGSIKGISSYLSYDSVKSIYQGKINLHRALLYSSYTSKPLLLTVTEYDPVISDISDLYNNIDKKSEHKNANLIHNNSKDSEISDFSTENDNAFVDAIEEYDNTLEIFFTLNNNNEEDFLNVSVISSPIEFYWDKPTILNLIECIKSYQERISQIALIHLQLLNKIYLLNKFHFFKIENNLINNQDIISIYGNTFQLKNISDYYKIQYLLNMKNYLMNINDIYSKVEKIEINSTKLEDLNDGNLIKLKKELKFIISSVENKNNWIHSVILMPPKFNFIHIQNIYIFLNSIYNTIQDNDFISSNISSDLNPILNSIHSNKKREKSNSKENFIEEMKYTNIELSNLIEYYNKWMFSGLINNCNEDHFNFDNDDFGLPCFSFNYFENKDNGCKRKKKPKVKLTYIIKGGSLSLIKDEKIYITIGINSICICLDIFDTGDKMVKFSINNCSLTINNKCILSRKNNKNDKPLLLMYINLYRPISNSILSSKDLKNELNIALKCYMDSLCYIIYYKDVLEFIDYINDGILDTLISKSYKAAKDITDKRVLLYYLSFDNSIIKLPEDCEIPVKTDFEDKENQINYYVNPKDVFDETLQRYKDILHDLLQEIYLDSKVPVQENDKLVDKSISSDVTQDNITISNYLLNRINNKESLFLLEKPISDYPRFKKILYEVKLFDKTQSYCEITTKNIKLFNKMIVNNRFIREFYEVKSLEENLELTDEFCKYDKMLWLTKLIIQDGVIDIIEKENGSEFIKGKILLNISGEIEYGTTTSFPKLTMKRICNDDSIESCNKNISLLNINMSPLKFNLSRQQLTFIINVLAENFSNKNIDLNNNFTEKNDIRKFENKSNKRNLLVNFKLPLLSLETSFSNFEFDSTGYKSSSLPLLLVKLFDCRIRSSILSINNESYMKLIITSKRYYFDDIRLTTNLKYRRIVHGYTPGHLISNEGLVLSTNDENESNDDHLLTEINNTIDKDSCSIQFICEISNLYGNHILLKAFNPRAFFGFNCIIDFYYYLSHSWRSSYFSTVDIKTQNKKSSFEDYHIIKQDYNSNDLSPGFLYRTNKEYIINEFEQLLASINKQGKFNFEFKLEIINGIFGFTNNPQKKVESERTESESLILIWETNINCSITTHENDTIIRNLNLINCSVYFSEISENYEENLDINTFSSQLLNPIFELNKNYKPISFEIPNINELKKVVIANSFDILSCGKYLSKIREIPEIYSTSISLSELIFILKIKDLNINITPYLLSILIDIAKNLFNDGPAISPLYTTRINNELTSKVNEINELESFNYSRLITNNQLLGPPPIRRIYDIKITIEKINVKFLNEFNSFNLFNQSFSHYFHNKSKLPIIKLEMCVPTWRIEIIPIKTNHTLKDVSMKVSILDINNQIWEPIVEKCIFSIYYFYDHLILYDPYVKPFKKSHRKYFHSNFSKSILINIKPSIYHSLKSFISYFKYFNNHNASNIHSEDNVQEINEFLDNSKLFPVYLFNHPILNLNDLSNLNYENVSIDENSEINSFESPIYLKYLNLTGLPYYCFTLKGNHLQKDAEFKLEQLLLLLPNNKIFDIKFIQNSNFRNKENSISLKYINNCNSQIPLLRISLPNKLFCVFSAPIDKDVLRLKREFKMLDIDFIIRVLVVYKSYNLAQNVLRYYNNLNNHNDICNNVIGSLPNGLNFTHFQYNVVSSADIDTIIPFHNLNYLKNCISTQSETYKRLFSDLNLDSSSKNSSNIILQDEKRKPSLNKSIAKSISKSFSKASSKSSVRNEIKENLDKKFGSKSNEKQILINNKNVYNNVVGQIISLNFVNKLFCLISTNRIINKTGIPLEICFLNENNVPIQLFDISRISVDKVITESILTQEISNNKFKYNSSHTNNSESNKTEKLNENSDYIFDDNINFNDPKAIPIWLNNTDTINTIISSINHIYNNEDDISGIFDSKNEINISSLKQKRFYYSYFLDNNHMLSVPQIALLNNHCKILFRPSIIGFFEIYNIHNQYNNDNDIDQMLFNKEIYNNYIHLMSKYNDDNIINEEFHHITYELLKIFKTSNGEFILDLYYTFWNNFISRFTDSSNKVMDLSYLYSRGWNQYPISTCRNNNSTLIHTCNVCPDFKNARKLENYKENAIYFQSYLQTYNSLFPGNSMIKNVYIYPSFSFFNLTQTLMEIKVKSLNYNLLYKNSTLNYKLKPLHHYNIYQLSNDMKLQFKVRIMLESSSLNECFSENKEQINVYTEWSSPIDLNFNELDLSFTLYCKNNNSAIDLHCIQIDKLSSDTFRPQFNSLISRMQKNIIAFNLSTWFINKTYHNIVPIFENSPFPYINVDPSLFYIGKNHSNNFLKYKQKIFLLNNRHNYLKIYFNSFENLRKKYKNLGNYIDDDVYLNEEKEILEIINSNQSSDDQNSNIGLLEIPPINDTYSFPIINDNKVYYFTVKSNSLFYNNDFSCNSKIITISPHIIIQNFTKDDFYWNSISFQNHKNISNDLISKINPNNYIDETNKYLLTSSSTDYVISQKIDHIKLENINKNENDEIRNFINENKNDNKGIIKDQKILLFLTRISSVSIKSDNSNRTGELRWSQPILISSEINGIYYLPIPDMNQRGFLINPKTYCVEIITSNGLFIIKIKEDFGDNLWDGVIFTNYCDYLSQINIETYHFEYNLEDKKRQRRFSLIGDNIDNVLIDDVTIRYIINNNNKDSKKISWSSPFLYNSRNCRLYIIPKFANENNQDLGKSDDGTSTGIMAFDINFHYNQNNPYQSKRYILSLPESDILKLCKIYPYLNSNYFLNNDAKNSKINNYPIATISITARKNGLYIDILPPRNHSSLLLNLLKMNNQIDQREFVKNINEREVKGGEINKNITNYQNLYIEDIYQKRINEINKFTNSDVWSLIYTYYRKVTLDISQIGISIISESRESEIIYIELSTIQFKKQEKNRNGIIETYRFVIGDIQIDNQYISSNSKFYLNQNKHYGVISTDNSNNINDTISDEGIMGINSSNTESSNINSNNIIPYVLLGNRTNINKSSESNSPFMTVKWSCSNAKSQWETIIYNFDCELSDLELNFDFNVYKILNEFIEECKGFNNKLYMLDLASILSKDLVFNDVTPNMTFSIEKIKIGSLNLYVWCSIPLVELNYIPEWFRIGLKILTVSNALELRGAPIKLEPHNLDNSIGTIRNIINAFYEYYMAELLWRIGTVLGHSSFVNIPLVPLQIGKNTLNMAFSTISIVNYNITSLLSNLTLDTEYINSRQRELIYSNSNNYKSIQNPSSTNYNMNHASSLKQGFVQAGHNITQGILSLGNVVTKPIEGAQKSGFAGFCSGLIKGVTSSVVRPIDHIGQALNNVIDGIQAEVNKPLGGYKQRMFRRRIPRMLYSHYNKITDYNINDALLRDIIGARFTKNLIQYFVIPTDNYSMPLVLLLFPKTIALVKLMSNFSISEYYNNSNNLQSFTNNKSLFHKSQLLWAVNINNIREVKASSHGLLIELSNDKRESLQIPICRFSLIKDINIALDNSQNNASPYLIFRK